MGLNENTDCSCLNGKGAADRAVSGLLSKVLNRRLWLWCVPCSERRRASCVVLRLFSGAAAPASGFNGRTLLGRGT